MASTTDRLEFVDALRGFALIGVLGANLFIFSGYTYMTDAQHAALPTARWDAPVRLLERILVENKFILNVPLVARNPLVLVNLAAGLVPAENAAGGPRASISSPMASAPTRPRCCWTA